MELSKEFYESAEAEFDGDRANVAAMNAVVHNGLFKSAVTEKAVRTSTHNYSIALKQGEITDQKKSGRCWMFAALNVMRYDVIRNLNLENFEFSQSYPLFFDKLEKSNYFLESILKTLDEPVNGRLLSFLLDAPINDGGQWDMFANIIRKYGAVPKEAMPESVSSSATSDVNQVLTEKLRTYACQLRTAHEEGASAEKLQSDKAEMMKEVYRILCICFGKPPETFDFSVRTKDDRYISEHGITPQEFFSKYVGWDLDDYISVINAPTADKPYHRSYSVKFLGNVVEGKPVRYLNLPVEMLKEAASAQIKDGKPVWFGCDVGKRSNDETGIMDLNIYDLKSLLNVEFPMTKAQRLDYGQSVMTHAMVFQGVELDENDKPLRWRVENSWGKDAGKGGYFVMSDDWFSEYTYQILINKKYLPKDCIDEYLAEPILLEPWDPMGSLAKAE